MFKKYIILVLLPIISFASVDKYVIDKTHFAVGFLVEHVGYAKKLWACFVILMVATRMM